MTYPPAHPRPPQGQSGPSSPSYAPQAAYGRPPVSAPQGGTTYGQAPTPAGYGAYVLPEQGAIPTQSVPHSPGASALPGQPHPSRVRTRLRTAVPAASAAVPAVSARLGRRFRVPKRSGHRTGLPLAGLPRPRRSTAAERPAPGEDLIPVHGRTTSCAVARRESSRTGHDDRCLRPRVRHLYDLSSQSGTWHHMGGGLSGHIHFCRCHTNDLVALLRIAPPVPQPAGHRDVGARAVVRLWGAHHAHQRP